MKENKEKEDKQTKKQIDILEKRTKDVIAIFGTEEDKKRIIDDERDER